MNPESANAPQPRHRQPPAAIADCDIHPARATLSELYP